MVAQVGSLPRGEIFRSVCVFVTCVDLGVDVCEDMFIFLFFCVVSRLRATCATAPGILVMAY